MGSEFNYPRDFKGIFIPREIWLDDDLNAIDKIILSEIYSLDVEDSDGCYASNEYLSKFCKCSVTKVSTSISHLIDLGYVKIAKSDGRKRFLKVSLSKFESQHFKKRKSESQKMKESNIDYKYSEKYSEEYNNNISPSELNSGVKETPARNEEKSRSKSGIKPSTDQQNKWIITKNQIISAMDKLGFGPDAPETEDALQVFRYYYRAYRSHTGHIHPNLNTKTMDSVVRNYVFGTDQLDSDTSVDTYMDLIDEHFKTDYGKEIDWNIQHFMTDGVRNYLYLKITA